MLNIKYLTDYWDTVLDASNEAGDALTVGEVFKDSAQLIDRTVKVVQLPPDSNDIHNPHRYESILPDSSARPRKRHLDQSPLGSCSSLRDVTYPDDRGSQPLESNGRSNKRQKTQASRPFGQLDSDRPIRSLEGFVKGLCTSSQSSARRGSPVHQVDDSQRSPLNKRMW